MKIAVSAMPSVKCGIIRGALDAINCLHRDLYNILKEHERILLKHRLRTILETVSLTTTDRQVGGVSLFKDIKCGIYAGLIKVLDNRWHYLHFYAEEEGSGFIQKISISNDLGTNCVKEETQHAAGGVFKLLGGGELPLPYVGNDQLIEFGQQGLFRATINYRKGFLTRLFS